MKIDILPGGNVKYSKGGSEIQCQELGKIFSKLGHKVFFINTIDKNKGKIPSIESDDLFYTYNVERVKFIGLNFLKYIKILSIEKPNIIYARVLKWHPYILLISKILRTPVIYNVSDDKSVGKYSFGNLGLLKFIEQIKNTFSLRFSDLIICQTCNQKRLLSINFNKDSIVIPNGHIIPKPPFRKNNPLIIAWIANIKTWKQPEIFIKLAEKCKDLDVRFVYAGRPKGGSYQKMLSRKTKKINNLEYLGEIPFDKTNELLSKSSMFVNTSLPEEGFPNTFIQSWMRETPTITLNFDPDDLIKKHKMGFHSQNFDQLVKDVRHLIENEDKRSEMGRNARKYAVENHDIDKIGKKYIEVFENISRD